MLMTGGYRDHWRGQLERLGRARRKAPVFLGFGRFGGDVETSETAPPENEIRTSACLSPPEYSIRGAEHQMGSFFRRNPDKVKISERREDAECDERKANLMCASFAGILVWSPRRYAMIAFGVCCAASNFAARRFYRGNRQA